MLECQKHYFDLPEEINYLNCAYMGPMLKQAQEIGHEEIDKRGRPYLYKRDDFFSPVQSLKESFSKLIDNTEADRIALIPSASYGLSNAAKNIHCTKGQSILIVSEQFPSNYYTWKRLADEKELEVKIIGPPNAETDQSRGWNEAILEQIDEHTAVVAMAIVHWADGTLFDLGAIRQRTEKYGAMLIIDGTQSIGALPFSIKEIPVDALICGSYKWMFGPYGLGLAYYGERFDQGVPIEENWINRKNSKQFENLVNYQKIYKPQAARYSVGEQSNFIYVRMLDISIKQILKWKPVNIQNYCKNLITPYLSEFRSIGCAFNSKENLAYHLFGIRLPERVDIIKLKNHFEEKNIFISIRGNSIRVAPNVYNEPKHIEQLLEALKKVLG